MHYRINNCASERLSFCFNHIYGLPSDHYDKFTNKYVFSLFSFVSDYIYGLCGYVWSCNCFFLFFWMLVVLSWFIMIYCVFIHFVMICCDLLCFYWFYYDLSCFNVFLCFLLISLRFQMFYLRHCCFFIKFLCLQSV